MISSHTIPLGANPIERAAHRRSDVSWLEGAINREDCLVFLMRDGLPLIEGEAGQALTAGARPSTEPRGLVWLGTDADRFTSGAMRIFMGEDKNGAPVFALILPDNFSLADSLLAGAGEFEDMRAAAASLPALEANLVSTARSLSLWHGSHQYCSKCGAKSEAVDAGWKRVCPSCGAEHFPRTDPVAIMLPFKDNRCLLGRSPGWPDGFYSCLAGFVEPGETIEQAAAREVYEEAGIVCDAEQAQYLFCQPWPFSSSLMIGIHLPAISEDIQIDPVEIETAGWFTRGEVKQMLQGSHPSVYMPPPLAIAHYVMKAWAED